MVLALFLFVSVVQYCFILYLFHVLNLYSTILANEDSCILYTAAALTSHIEVGGVRVGDSGAVLSHALVFAFVRFLTVSYL